MIRKALHKLKKYCCEELNNIENYQNAINEPELYDLHHKLGLQHTRKELLELNLYYNRHASELIFLTHSEHTKIHMDGHNVTDETKNKISNSNKGKTTRKGTYHSDETKQKISNSLKGHLPWRTGSHSEESKQKMRKSKIKYKWLTPTGEIIEMSINHAKRYHPDWVCLNEVL